MGLAGFNRARLRKADGVAEVTPELKPKGPYVKQTIEEKMYCEQCDKHFQNTRAYELHMKTSKVHK